MAPFLLFALVTAAEPQRAAMAPLTGEEDVWQLVQKLHTAAAYDAFRKRYPNGQHRDEAVEAYFRLRGEAVPPMPRPIAPPAAPPVITPLPANAVSACAQLQYGPGMHDSPEAQAFLAARRANRPADYQAYIGKFPNGVCVGEANDFIKMRAARKLLYKPVAGLGPLAPQAMSKAIFTEDDYPSQALRNDEQGRVVAEWDVAEDGMAESCRIVQSSGSASLDDVTCRIIVRRIRYDPARDASGVPIRSVDRMSIGWILPADPPTPPAGQPTQ